MKNDKRRKDNLCWLVECKFRKGTEWAEMDGDDRLHTPEDALVKTLLSKNAGLSDPN